MHIRNKLKMLFSQPFARERQHYEAQAEERIEPIAPEPSGKRDLSMSCEERRQHPRVKCAGQSLFALEAVCEGIGPVLDIGLGGFSVRTDSNPAGNGTTQVMNLYFANNLLCLKQVHCGLVSFQETRQDGDASGGRWFRGNYRFLFLSEGQRNQLLFAMRLNLTSGGGEISASP